MPSLTVAQQSALAPLLDDFRAYRRSLYSEPAQDSAWNGFELRYEFAVGAESADHEVALESPEFHGGHLDWYSFELGRQGLRGPSSALTTRAEITFLPTRLTFRGMPSTRWWNFEDGLTDFGNLQADKVDLAKLLVMEFALLGADDWFQLPLPLEVGSLSTVTTLIVTDTFGERTLIRPTSDQ